MSGGGVALAGQSACEPAGGLAALSAGRVGGRPRAAAQGTCSQSRWICRDQPEIALEQLRWACAAGLPRGVVLLDAGYGNNSELRADITALDLTYVAGILSTTTVWLPGTAPLPPKRWSGRGRPTTRLRFDGRRQPVSVKELALGLSKRAWLRRRLTMTRVQPSRSPRALRVCAFASPIAMISAPIRDRKSGC